MLLGEPPDEPALRCQALLATKGDRPAWNDRRQSAYYKVLPLTARIDEENPMYAQFSETHGVTLDKLVTPDPELVVELEQTTYNVFHVVNAVGSPYIPDQDEFVIPYGIRSVIGFFGMLPSGNLFSVVLFTRHVIPRALGETFKTLALNVKMAVLPFDGANAFAPTSARAPGDTPAREPTRFRSEAAGLRQLVQVQEQVVVDQSARIAEIVATLQAQTRELTDTNSALNREIAENDRLREQAAAAAVIQERNRLARELHDSVTQSLYSFIGADLQREQMKLFPIAFLEVIPAAGHNMFLDNPDASLDAVRRYFAKDEGK